MKTEEELLLELRDLNHPTDEKRLDEILNLNRQIKSERIQSQVADNYRSIAEVIHLDAMASKFGKPETGWKCALEMWEKVKPFYPNDTDIDGLILECKSSLKEKL